MEVPPTDACHVLAVPYPARGHINALMNFCKLLVTLQNDIVITVAATEDWVGIIEPDPARPDNIRFGSMPNVIPSELTKAADHIGFWDAFMNNMEAPFEELLDRLEPPPTIIINDTFSFWAVAVGNRRNIPVASFWPMSATVYSVLLHYHLLHLNGHYPLDFSENGDKRVDYIPGVPPTRLADLPLVEGSFYSQKLLELCNKAIQSASKAQYLLVASIYQLEPHVIDVLKAELSIPIYTIGPAIPYFTLGDHKLSLNTDSSYFEWLDQQPNNSVVYISQGSLFSVSSTQIEEITSGLRESGVRFLWIARKDASRLKEICGDKGLVLEWCDQMRVLTHPAIGGFWTHCGWNSTKEGIFAGVPFLTYPVIADQGLDSKMIVEEWKVGWRVKEDVKVDSLVRKDEIVRLLNKFMDLENDEVRDMRNRAKELQEVFHGGINGGSAQDINAFVKDMTMIALK